MSERHNDRNKVMATTQSYFPRKSESAPMIYAYEDKYDPQLRGLLKVGYTTIGVQQRVRQQYRRCHHSAIRQTSSLCPWRQWQAMCLHTCGRRKYRSNACPFSHLTFQYVQMRVPLGFIRKALVIRLSFIDTKILPFEISQDSLGFLLTYSYLCRHEENHDSFADGFLRSNSSGTNLS